MYQLLTAVSIFWINEHHSIPQCTTGYVGAEHQASWGGSIDPTLLITPTALASTILMLGSCNFARSKINAISKIHHKIAKSFKALQTNVIDNLLKSKILNLKKLISP